jgi:ribosomal protein L40E
MACTPINATSATYTGVIPSSTSTTVYWQVVVVDAAGNTLVIDNNGQPYSYSYPNLSIQEVRDPPASLDLNTVSNYTVQILVPDNSQFMAYVLIEYTMNDWKGLQVVNMTALSPTLYTCTFTNFASNVTVLNYTVVGVDIFGNQVPLGKDRSIAIYPAMPAWDMSGNVQLAAIIISLFVGIACGTIYSKMVRGKPTLRQLTLAEKTRLDVAESERQEKGAPFWSSGITAAVTFVIVGGLLAMAVISLVWWQYPQISMWFFAGLFLATTFLWVLVTDAEVARTLRSGQTKMRRGSMTLVLGVGFSIFLTLLAILVIGGTVPWWQVRVNQSAYNIVGLQIPKMLTSLASAFFSSILLLSWTVGKDVSRTAKDLHNHELQHANPGLLLERREGAISQIEGAVGMKAVIFIALIGATVIFASDLNIYIAQGLTIIVPFVIGALAVLGLHALWRNLKPEEGEDVVFDHVTICHSCGAETALGGLYCENCGARIIAGTRMLDGQECPRCKIMNPSTAKHCHYCGADLERAIVPNPDIDHEKPPSANTQTE